MAFKHNKGRWKLKNYAKRVLCKADFEVFWAQKEVVGATKWVPGTLDSEHKCLFII